MKDSLNVLPLLLVGTGVILFSFSDVVFKILTSLDILWWDFLVFGVPFEILLILIITGIRKDFNKRKIYEELMPKRLFYPVLRGVISVFALASVFISLKNLPLSLTTMLIQTTPIWMAIISFFSYEEKPSFVIIFSIILGMLGIVFIINPTLKFTDINVFLIFPVIVAIINAFMNYIVTRRPNDASPMSYALVLFIINGLAGIIIWLYFGINFPNLYELTLIILAALLGATAFIFISYGYSIAKGHFARTGVMGFIQLPASIVLGFFIFNESLKFNAYFGSLLIIIAGANAIYGLKNAN